MAKRKPVNMAKGKRVRVIQIPRTAAKRRELLRAVQEREAATIQRQAVTRDLIERDRQFLGDLHSKLLQLEDERRAAGARSDVRAAVEKSIELCKVKGEFADTIIELGGMLLESSGGSKPAVEAEIAAARKMKRASQREIAAWKRRVKFKLA